ncbi:DNA-3-methyladenine glycosylase I [Pseudomonas sp. Marseille-QA0892]
MRDFQWMYEYCVNRFGSVKALEARLPVPRSQKALATMSDDRYLSTLTLRIFRAGLKHSLVDAKWPEFEKAFFGFDPEKVSLMGGDHIERLMQNSALIRHLGKLRSVPRNAQMILDIQRTHGSFAAFIAEYPTDQIVTLWRELARQGDQLGGLSLPRFLRMVGKDTFVPTTDVAAALKAQGVIDKFTMSQKTLSAMQDAFNHWHAQSNRPLCQLSVMLAHTVNH